MAKETKRKSSARRKGKTAKAVRSTSRADAKRSKAGISDATAKVRVYRQGLGDCILISLPRTDKRDFTILVDCGVAIATSNAGEIMSKVVEHIHGSTNGHVDVLAVTHEHWDHVSGFTQAKNTFGKIQFGEVWFAWTENPNDPLAQKLKKQHADALNAVEMCASARAVSGAAQGALDLMQIAGMVGAAGEKTRAAMEIAKGLAPGKVVYRMPGESPIEVDGTGARIYVLGPPHDEKAIRRINPSMRNPETYQLALDGTGVLAAGVLNALSPSADRDFRPFADASNIPIDTAKGMEFFRHHYWGVPGDDSEWRRIDAEWLGTADELALMLQSATNNTSLVLAIELADHRVLLFAADAQVGNWLSWRNVSWNLRDGREIAGLDLLKRTVFYKVGHHGSHNATLRKQGLELMTGLRTAVIPVDEVVAKKMRWGAMPLASLVDALETVTDQRTYRTDRPAAATAELTVDDLFFEFQI